MLAEMSAKTNAKYPGGVLGGGFMIISIKKGVTASWNQLRNYKKLEKVKLNVRKNQGVPTMFYRGNALGLGNPLRKDGNTAIENKTPHHSFSCFYVQFPTTS